MTEQPRQPRRTTPPAADTLLGSPTADATLGSLTPGPRDSQVEVGPTPALVEGQPLKLPRGGWIAMRMSGGLRFTSRQVAIFRDGRLARSGIGDGEAGPRDAGRLTDAEKEQLRAVLEAVSFRRLPATTGRQNPDAYAYEIAARPKRHAYVVEVFDGSIPAALAPLVALLRRIMLAQG
jgi:hypothetical protein